MIRRYLLPLLLLFLSSLSQAATGSIPATRSTTDFTWILDSLSGTLQSVADSACASAMPRNYPSVTPQGAQITSTNYGTFQCMGKDYTGQVAPYMYLQANKGQGVLECPSGYTLNGEMCDPLSPCEQVKGLINGTPQAIRYFSVPVGGGNATGTYCDSGCAVKLAVAGTGYYTDGKNNSFQRSMMYTGQSCTNEPNAPAQFTADKQPTEPPKKPPCSPGEGVMTSSSGTIACVPPGTPNSNPPVVTKTAETTTNPDGTKKTTETTTTRDTSTGVEDKTTTTTTKDANGNSTGTTTTNTQTGTTTGGNPEKPGDSDFCQKNPTLDICTGKLNKEETQKKIADDIKSLTDPGSTSTDPLKNATHTTESENQLKTENDKFTDAAKGITDPTASSKSSWQQAMESGWFSAIPSSGCTPITGTVGGRQFTIDHCEKASQISDIMSYALWFMLVVGSFVMFTGGQVRTQ